MPVRRPLASHWFTSTRKVVRLLFLGESGAEATGGLAPLRALTLPARHVYGKLHTSTANPRSGTQRTGTSVAGRSQTSPADRSSSFVSQDRRPPPARIRSAFIWPPSPSGKSTVPA